VLLCFHLLLQGVVLLIALAVSVAVALLVRWLLVPYLLRTVDPRWDFSATDMQSVSENPSTDPVTPAVTAVTLRVLPLRDTSMDAHVMQDHETSSASEVDRDRNPPPAEIDDLDVHHDEQNEAVQLRHQSTLRSDQSSSVGGSREQSSHRQSQLRSEEEPHVDIVDMRKTWEWKERLHDFGYAVRAAAFRYDRPFFSVHDVTAGSDSHLMLEHVWLCLQRSRAGRCVGR